MQNKYTLYVHLKLSFIPNKCIVRKINNYGSNQYPTCPLERKNTAFVPFIAFQLNTGINIKEFNQSSDCALSKILPT